MSALGSATMAIVLVSTSVALLGQAASAPNPYKWDEAWKPPLPDGREWGSSAGVGVDRNGNVYVAERCGGNPLGCAGKTFGKDGVGHQVFKFSPDGKVLMRLGKAGVAGDGPDTFNQPSAVVVAPNGDIFVADGHIGDNSNHRVVKFTNNRIQIFDQEGIFLEQWKQFSRPSGIFINRDDIMFVIDSETKSVQGYGYNPGGSRGIRIGSARDGKVTAFIPDPETDPDHSGSTGGEGIAEFTGIIYGFGDHRQKMVAQRRYVKK